MDINNIYYGLEPEKKERLEKIEVILEQIPMTDESFDNAYEEFREIINSTGCTTRVVSLEDKFSKLFRDAKDRLNFQFVSFYGLWTAEIVALLINLYFLPTVLSTLSAENGGEYFCMFIISFETTLTIATIFQISFKSVTIKNKTDHATLILIWIALSVFIMMLACVSLTF